MMKKYWCYFLFLLLICYLIIFGILMFTQGFLLSRNTFGDISTCDLYNDIDCNLPDNSLASDQCISDDDHGFLLPNTNNTSLICFPKRSKVVLLIIDALRYDFTTYDPELKHPLPYQNKLEIIHDMLKHKPLNSRLFKFIADPPTTTMQRLKALTTGSLPTFVDAGSNFATPEINEDNLIDQVVRNKQNIIFMGDDTWVGLYPNRFKRNWPFPSFNVWDLDTVDNGVVRHLYTEMGKSDWSMIIGHFLGVDHCGHRYGPLHIEMKRKLTEMNKVIKNIINKLDDDTILFVIGDHGMTNTGDHGGESEQEVSAAMFVYSSKPLIHINNKEELTFVKQIDLVPTLATILGVPIPFSNLGTIIFEAIPSTNSYHKNLQFCLRSLWSNVHQMLKYINRYSVAAHDFDKNKLKIMEAQYTVLNERLNNIENEGEFQQFIQDTQAYLVFIREMCEEVWIQFDSFAMSRGLLLTFITVFFVYMIVYGIPLQNLQKILSGTFIFYSYILIMFIGTNIIILYNLLVIENYVLLLFCSTAIISVFMFTFLIVHQWEVISVHWYENAKKRNFLDIVCRLVLLVTSCALFTNSYILEEARVLSFILLSLVFLVIYTLRETRAGNNRFKVNDKLPLFRFKWNSIRAKLIVMGLLLGIVIRFSMYFWRCREEQKSCSWSMNEEIIKVNNDNAKYKCIATLIFLASFVTLIKIWLRSCGNLVGFSPLVTLTKYAPTVIVVCLGGYWILHRFPDNVKLVTTWNTDILIWTVYILLISIIIVVITQPLPIFVLPRKRDISVHYEDNVIPQLFHQVKGMFQESKNNENDVNNVPVVYGLGTVYSAPFIIISMVIVLMMSMLLGDILAISAVNMYCAAILVLIIVSISHYEKAVNTSQLFVIPETSVLTWVLLSQYFFYGTSHQPSFPSIQWESAFVGTAGLFTNNFIPAILVGINTFGSYIFFGLMLPLLTIFPFTLYVMFPSLSTAKSLEIKSMRRGELLLYENEDNLFKSVFINSCKYILYHSVRIFICMLSATIHCRHLMVWSIFAPKLIFEVIGVLVSLSAVLISNLILVNINSNVEKLVLNLEKQNR